MDERRMKRMLFRFLRQYFQDDEFEENKIQFRESQRLLAEYKEFIQKEKAEPKNEDKEKVDPDFLVMIWASIGLALSIGVEAAKNLPKPVTSVSGVNEVVWLVIALYIVFYAVRNGVFALELTRDYAKSKTKSGYKTFAITLTLGIVIVFVGLVVMAQFGK